MTFTDAEKLAEIKREIRMRNSVYPKLIKSRMLSVENASRQIAILEEIAQNYADNISYSQHKEQG